MGSTFGHLDPQRPRRLRAAQLAIAASAGSKSCLLVEAALAWGRTFHGYPSKISLYIHMHILIYYIHIYIYIYMYIHMYTFFVNGRCCFEVLTIRALCLGCEDFEVDSTRLKYRCRVMYAGFPSFSGFGIRGRSYSNFMASSATSRT